MGQTNREAPAEELARFRRELGSELRGAVEDLERRIAWVNEEFGKMEADFRQRVDSLLRRLDEYDARQAAERHKDPTQRETQE